LQLGPVAVDISDAIGQVLLGQVIDAHDLGIGVIEGQDAQRIGNFEAPHLGDPGDALVVALLGVDADDRESCALGGVEQALGRRQLHRLQLGLDLRLCMAGAEYGKGCHDHHPGAHPRRLAPGLVIGMNGALGCVAVVLGELPAADPGQQATGDHEGRGDLVRECDQEERIGEQRGEIGQLGAPVAVGGADRVLHEGVRGQDEDRRDGATQRDQVHAQVVQDARQPVPAEDPQTDERRLQEEGDQGFESQRRAEDIADEAGVLRPVHTELELLHDAGDHARREVDEEKLREKLGEAQPLIVSSAQPSGLQNRDHPAGPDGHWHEEEVVDSGDPELPTREYLCVHAANLHPSQGMIIVFGNPGGVCFTPR